MLRIIQNSSAAGAKSYYSTADYYSEGQELVGHWHGRAADMLGLSGEIDRKDWDALCDNRKPGTGAPLTSRQKADRRIGYDFNFHVPKSVSLLYGLTGDERILSAFREAVDATMQDMEAEVQARVRASGKNEDRTTGNMVWGEFVHTTARPVGGVPDPHLHAHCFVFNATWDDAEARWKAGQFAGLKRDAPYFEAVFHTRLARNLQDLGLPVERTRTGWELSGLTPETLQRFSRRTALIEEKAHELGITDPALKGELGAKTRSGKAKEMGLPELRLLWQERLSAGEADALQRLQDRIGSEAVPADDRAVEDGVARAMAHCFERRSVVPERTLIAAALKGSYGAGNLATVLAQLSEQPLLKAKRDGRLCVTTREVLAEETRMVDFARKGRGTCARFASEPHVFKREWLNEGQQKAVQHLLGSYDRVMLVRGGAGTGKTSMMSELVEGIEASGRKVFTFAPSAEASRGVLRAEGFENADTVARLLLDEKLQLEVRDQVILVDEAGLMSTKATAQLFDLAERANARVILSGDRKQHGSVERGAALKLLEEEAGLVPAEIREIQRQKGDYRLAVKALSEGEIESGFRQLDRLGWVLEADPSERYAMLAADYVGAVSAGKSALVVSPTQLEGEWITAEVRSRLQEAGRVSKEERQILVLESRNLTAGERADTVNLVAGDVAVFHQNAAGHRKGDRVVVGEGEVPVDAASRYQLFRPTEIAVAPGDVLRVTKNGTTADGKHRLNNGALYRLKGFDKAGNLVLANGWTVAKDYGHLAHGYCVTSHASQGKTVDCVFIGQSGASVPASSPEQFYVSVSRGREKAVVYTDDKRALLEAVSNSEERVSATELLRERGKTIQRAKLMEQSARPLQREAKERAYG